MKKSHASDGTRNALQDNTALQEAFQRGENDLLDELRFIWDLPEGQPIRAIGKIRIQPLETGEAWFLDNLEHPEKGFGFRYPQTQFGLRELNRLPSAFIPGGYTRSFVDKNSAFEGDLWTIAELELSPIEEREKHANPWLLTVKSGTLRPLCQIPNEWQIMVTGPESARRISELARDEIEEYVRTSVLEEDEELARRIAANEKRFEELKKARQVAEEKAAKVRSEIESKIATDRQHHAAIESKAKELEVWFRKEQKRIASDHHALEQEKKAMEFACRRLQELVSQKAHRLVALGLVDADDITTLLPRAEEVSDDRAGVTFSDALPDGFPQLALLLQSRLAKRGLLYTQSQLRDFTALLRTRDLIVLAGDSGSGKTSIIKAAAEIIGGKSIIIPVKPNWTGPEDLLGYFNPMERSYQSTPFLDALRDAARHPHVPYFICLDEMNLARIEHYFADFLSLLENRSDTAEISLYTSDEESHAVVANGIFLDIEEEARRRSGLGEDATIQAMLRNDQANAELHRIGGFADTESVLVHHERLRRSLATQIKMPTSIKLSGNVWILGAVNMDDTTHQLSPKVLDRVQVLRFRNPMLTDWDLVEAQVKAANQSFPEDLGPLSLTPHDIGMRGEYPAFDRQDPNVAFLSKLSRDYLDPLGVEFGLRAIRQSQGYIDAAKAAGISPDEALDNVIKHKILPKIAFDTARPAGNGRSRRELLDTMRTELVQRLEGTNVDLNESSIAELERMIRLADGNNGIINYWLR